MKLTFSIDTVGRILQGKEPATWQMLDDRACGVHNFALDHMPGGSVRFENWVGLHCENWRHAREFLALPTRELVHNDSYHAQAHSQNRLDISTFQFHIAIEDAFAAAKMPVDQFAILNRNQSILEPHMVQITDQIKMQVRTMKALLLAMAEPAVHLLFEQGFNDYDLLQFT